MQVALQLGAQGNDISINVSKVTDSIYTFGCAEVQVAAINTSEGIIIIDTHRSPSVMQKILERVKETFGNKPIKYVINTHGHQDHTGGNQLFDPAIIIGHTNAPEYIRQFPANTIRNIWFPGDHAKELAKDLPYLEGEEKVLLQQNVNAWELIAGDMETRYKLTPPQLTVRNGDELTSGGITLNFFSCGTLHTNNDLFVVVPELNVMFTGDVMSRYSQWSFNPNALTDIKELISLLKKIVRDFPKLKYVIPAHDEPFPASDLKKTILLLEERESEIDYSASGALYLKSVIASKEFKSVIAGFINNSRLAGLTFDESELSQLAQEYESRGKLTESIAILELSLNLLKSPLLVYDDLGRNYLKTGQEEKAVKSYETLLKIFPQYRIAGEILKRIRK